jgi:hypothetical protein
MPYQTSNTATCFDHQAVIFKPLKYVSEITIAALLLYD